MIFFFCYFFSLLITVNLLIKKNEVNFAKSQLFRAIARISPHSFIQAVKDQIELLKYQLKVSVSQP